MDIVSPKIVWQEYDREALPLDISVISDVTGEKQRVIRAYFNGVKPSETTFARVFAKYATPLGDGPFPTAVIARDAGISADSVDTLPFTSRGIAVCVVDYAGKRDDTPFYTIYPDTASYADFTADCLASAPEDARNNCWIVWAKVLLRGITFACSFAATDKARVAVCGDGVAGASAWKACAVDETIAAGISMYSSRFAPERGDNDPAYLVYEAALMEASYAPLIKVPLLVIAASNEQDDSIDDISEAYSMIPKLSGSRFSVSERMHHGTGVKQKNNMLLWLDYYLFGKGTIPQEPVLTASCSDHKLYFEIKTTADAETELFVSQAMQRGALRNWHSEKLVQTGDGEFVSRREIFDVNKNVHAFVNIYTGDFSVSTPLLTKLPSAMGVTATPLKTSRLIYDSESGIDDWTAFDENGGGSAKMAKGPFDIEGVCADGGSLMTYKLAEKQYKSSGDDLLQICLYCDTQQEITLVITEKTVTGNEIKFGQYCAVVSIGPDDNWRKLNLEPSDFASDTDVADSWADIISLRIDGARPVLVKSLLWV